MPSYFVQSDSDSKNWVSLLNEEHIEDAIHYTILEELGLFAGRSLRALASEHAKATNV